MGWTSRFTSVSFGSNYPFTIRCNSYNKFLLITKMGQGLQAAWQQLAHMLLFCPRPAQCQVLKLFPMFGIGEDDVHQFCPIFLHLWDGYLLPLELAGLGCDPHHVIFISPFSNCTYFFYHAYPFWRESLPSNAPSGGWFIQSEILRLEWRWSF